MVPLDGREKIPRQPTGVGSLFDKVQDRGAAQNPMEFLRLAGQKFAEERTGRDGGEEVAPRASPGFRGGIKTEGGMVKGFFHELIEREGAVLPDFGTQQFGKGRIQGFRILFGITKGGEIDGRPPHFKFRKVKQFLGLWCMLPCLALAQTDKETPSLNLSDLPSAQTQPKLPGLDEPAPTPDLSTVQPSDSNSSLPQVRPADKEKDKSKDQDWAAQAMMQKKEEAKKMEQEQAALADQKARESALASEKEKKEKQKNVDSSTQPAVAKNAAPSLGGGMDQKLPSVTGLEGVKPRAMASGDGRVQPGFDSFTGPSGTGPLGKDFQSGAKPIMPGTATADGRMQLPPQPPEPPSGAYKRISQDPSSMPPGYGEKKPVAPPPPKPVAIPPNPSTGDPKRVIDDSKAGYSPYDNSRKVPDPRSQRRF